MNHNLVLSLILFVVFVFVRGCFSWLCQHIASCFLCIVPFTPLAHLVSFRKI